MALRNMAFWRAICMLLHDETWLFVSNRGFWLYGACLLFK